LDARQRGKWGEEIALAYLLRSGYIKIATGFRSRFGEIDIIVRNSEYTVFVEVKLRKNANFAQAREFVSNKKQDKIRATASLWLTSHRAALQPRFDVIEIYAPDDTSTPEIIHIENAF